MSSLRYSYMNTGTFVKWVGETDANLMDAKWYYIAFESLRGEGKVQITIEILEARAKMLRRILSEAPSILGKLFEEIFLLSEFAAGHPNLNPVDEGFPIEQMIIGGLKRCVCVCVCVSVCNTSHAPNIDVAALSPKSNTAKLP
jgi:hypothetical protein